MNKTKKEIVDAYLEKYYNEVTTLKQSGNIRWESLVPKILIQDYLKGQDLDFSLTGEYIRKRFSYLTGKGALKIVEQTLEEQFTEIASPTFKPFFEDPEKEKSWIETEMKKLEIKGREQFLENILRSNPTDTRKPFCYEYKENAEKKTAEVKTETEVEIKTAEELFEHLELDSNKWKITNWWCKRSASGRYAVSANLKNIEHTSEGIHLTDEFITNLAKIQPIADSLLSDTLISSFFGKSIRPKSKASLLIPKQDAHWNKFDVDGKNSIEGRFANFSKILLGQLEKARQTNDIEEINYIIGSDEFNSEWTNLTTKGTPQQNILSHQEAFEKITNFNIETIKLLRYYTPKVNVILLNGNHDEFVGWHLAHVLKTVFSKIDSVNIDSEVQNTKVIAYKSNLMLLNHSDAIKPADLAAKFPIIAKEQWSQHSNYYVISGDKHHEKSHDYNGTIFYQVPQLSTSKSKWDDKQGYTTSKAEFIAFLFEEDGLASILRKNM